MASSRGIQRVLSKLEDSLLAGNYYEAHQMYRTLYYRYLSQKKYTELMDLLYHGSSRLLLKNETSSGTDLAILLIDVMDKSDAPVNKENIDKITCLLSYIRAEIPERETFLAHAIRWSTGKSENKHGHPLLHQAAAEIFWREKNYYLARFHFLHSTDGGGCAKMLVELHMSQGFPSEIDLFVAQAVLQYLCLQNKKAATLVFTYYISQHPNIKEKNPPYLLPLLNFLWFLLNAIESGKLTVFKTLREKYQPSLRRDPSYDDYLERIAQIFFGVKAPQQQRPRGLFENILQMFGRDDDDDEDDDSEEAGPSSQSTAPPRQSRFTVMETDDLE